MNGTDIVYAAPLEGSSLVYLALDPLPLDFSVAKDQVTKVVPQVISAEGHSPEDFGYSSFSFEVVETVNFYVSINTFNTTTSTWKLTSSELTVTCAAENTLPAEALELQVDPAHLFINLTKDYTGKIAFQSYRDGNYEIYVMDADGSNQTRLTFNTDSTPELF